MLDQTAKALDGDELEHLQDALVDAFPTIARLEQFARIRLNINLESVSEGNLVERVFALLTKWAEPSARLWHVVRQARRANLTNHRLRAFERDYLPEFTTEQLIELEEAARIRVVHGERDRGRLCQLATASIDPHWTFPLEPPNESTLTMFRRLVDSLSSGLPQSGSGLFPLHDFAERLARDPLGAASAGELRAWVAKTGGEPGKLGGSPETSVVKRLIFFLKCDSGEKATLEPSDLVILEGYLWKFGVGDEPINRRAEHLFGPVSVKLEQVPSKLSEIRKSKGLLGKHLVDVGSQMTIELCLRDNLLAADVDRWMLQITSTWRVALGEQYLVVVRSYERIYHDEWNIRERWKPKWENLKAGGEKAPTSIDVGLRLGCCR